MRKIGLMIALLWLAVGVSAAEHSGIVELQGGGSKLMSGNNVWGPWGGIGLRYQCLYSANKQFLIGPAVGLDVAYAKVHYQTALDRTFSLRDHEQVSNEVIYTLSGTYKESFQHVRLQLPILLAMRIYGITCNVGIGANVWKQLGYEETVLERHSTAYYPSYDVPIIDEDPAGLLKYEDFCRPLGMQNMEWNMMVMGELGYEWQVSAEKAVGLQVMAQYAVFSSRVPALDLGLKIYYRFAKSTSRHRKGSCNCYNM